MSQKNELRLTRTKRLKRIIFSLLIQKLFMDSKKSRVTRLSAKFIFLVHETYPEAKFYHSREQLWKSFGKTIGESEWVGFEFGVASGDATRVFMNMPYAKHCLQWNGFDTFHGLPTPWGDLPKGAFSTDGNPPSIKNQIINWHIGLIEETCTEINSLDHLDKNFIIIFDFDLYGATKTAWNVISKYLKTGDIIYFDEAYEIDESKIINEILHSGLELGSLGYTTMGIAYKII